MVVNLPSLTPFVVTCAGTTCVTREGEQSNDWLLGPRPTGRASLTASA